MLHSQSKSQNHKMIYLNLLYQNQISRQWKNCPLSRYKQQNCVLHCSRLHTWICLLFQSFSHQIIVLKTNTHFINWFCHKHGRVSDVFLILQNILTLIILTLHRIIMKCPSSCGNKPDMDVMSCYISCSIHATNSTKTVTSYYLYYKCGQWLHWVHNIMW